MYATTAPASTATLISKKNNQSSITMRYFMRLSFRGEHFHGWQSQPHDISVQETVEKVLSTLAHPHKHNRCRTHRRQGQRQDDDCAFRCRPAHSRHRKTHSQHEWHTQPRRGNSCHFPCARHGSCAFRRHKPHLQIFCAHREIPISLSAKLALSALARL